MALLEGWMAYAWMMLAGSSVLLGGAVASWWRDFGARAPIKRTAVFEHGPIR